MLAGKLKQSRYGSLSFTYTAHYLEQNRNAISLSLPLQQQPFNGDRVKAFFSGLLPDEIIKQRLASYLGLSAQNPFALLRAIGGECAGALSLYPEGQLPPDDTTKDVEILDDSKLRDILNLLKRHPLLAGEDNIRLSLAGAQDKLAVGLVKGKVALVKGVTPTTHILKPLIEQVADSVHNELFCMQLAQRVGITTPQTCIHFVGNTPCYIVERYDRHSAKDGTVMRIHQEDFCQALGILPELKYEREGGPSLATCQAVLANHSAKPAVDQLGLLEITIFNYLIGNADDHGKNFSLLYQAAKPQLAPAYDLLSTAVYPELSTKMAMKIGGKYKPDDVFIRHWHRLVTNTQAARSNLEKLLYTLAQRTLECSAELKQRFDQQGLKTNIIDDICTLIKVRANRIME
jgi:serine/threonine-protein kinase HipA